MKQWRVSLLLKEGKESTSLGVCDGLKAKLLVVKLCHCQIILRLVRSDCYRLSNNVFFFAGAASGNDFQWCFSQVKGAIDEDVAEGMLLTLARGLGYKR